MNYTTLIQSKKIMTKKMQLVSHVLVDPHLDGIIGRTIIKPKI